MCGEYSIGLKATIRMSSQKWEDNKGHCNMVTNEPRKDNNGKDLVQVNIAM